MIYIASLNSKDKDEAVLKRYQYIDNLPTVYRVITDPSCTEIILKDDFLKANFNETAIPSFLEQIKLINPKLKVTALGDYSNYFNANLNTMDFLNSPDEFLKYCISNTDTMMNFVKTLTEKYKHDYNEALAANNKIATMQLQISAANNEISEALEKRDKALKMYNDASNSLDKLINRINTSTGQKMDMSKTNGIKIEMSNYDRILYIKEVSRVRFVDTLIFFIQEVMKALYQVPARLLVMEAEYADNRSIYYPNCKSTFTISDVVNSDIFVTGYQQKLIEDVLSNPNMYPYLIVLDRTMTNDIYIKGEKVETLFTASDYNDIKTFIPTNRIISYSPDTLHINFIKNYDKMSYEEKVSRYSSMPIFTTIVSDILEGGKA